MVNANNGKIRRRQALVDIRNQINSFALYEPNEKAVSNAKTKTTMTTTVTTPKIEREHRYYYSKNAPTNSNQIANTTTANKSRNVLSGAISTPDSIVEPRVAAARLEVKEKHSLTAKPILSQKNYTSSMIKRLPARHRSPPRRFLNPVPRIAPRRSQTCVRKEPSTTLISKKASEVTDRIERSRRTKNSVSWALEANNGGLLGSDDLCNSDAPSDGIAVPKRRIITEEVDQLDRIECTRLKGCTKIRASQSIAPRPRTRRSSEQSEWPLSLSHRSLFEKTKVAENDSIGEGEGEKSKRDTIQTKSDRKHHQNCDTRRQHQVSSSAEIPNRKPLRDLQQPLLSQSLPQNQGKGQSQSFPIEYSKSIQNLVTKTDAKEVSPRLHRAAKNNKNNVTIVIRSRPLLDHEIQRGDFSAIEIPPESLRTLALYEKDTSDTIHAHAQDRTPVSDSWKAHVIKFDAVFSERSSFEEFYTRTVEQNVQDALNGGMGVVVLCGSDEYGKSHTMSDIEQRVASDMFAEGCAIKPSSHQNCSISLSCLGLGRPPCNRNSSNNDNGLCIDLLSPVHHFVEIIDNTNDIYKKAKHRAHRATEMNISSAREFLEAISSAKQRLASERIIRRESESSSYFLCQISIWKKSTPPVCSSTTKHSPGILWLLLCPCGDQIYCSTGKTNNNDLTCHGRDSTNTSNPLANMMEMIQNNNKQIQQHHRRCNLTRLLGQSIVTQNEPPGICLVASVSPSSRDTEATLLTMLSAREYMAQSKKAVSCKNNVRPETTKETCKGSNANDEGGESRSLVLPRQWSKAELMEWLCKKRFIRDNALASQGHTNKELSGKAIMVMTKVQLEDCFFRSDSNGSCQANKLFMALRAENDRVARLRVKRKFALSKRHTKLQ